MVRTRLSVCLVMLAQCVLAAIGISPITKTFNKNEGGAAILTSGSGAWTVSANVPWITVVKSSGNAGESCTYTVSTNMTADTRVGVITMAENTYTVTQTGYAATLSPSAKTVDLNEGSFAVTVAVDASMNSGLKFVRIVDVLPTIVSRTWDGRKFGGTGTCFRWSKQCGRL